MTISKDEDDADDEYVEDETEKKAQYEILDENGTFLSIFYVFYPFLATMIFDRHQDAVFCSRVSPNGEFIASGGQDDRGFVYTPQGDLVLALFGHKGNLLHENFENHSLDGI